VDGTRYIREKVIKMTVTLKECMTIAKKLGYGIHVKEGVYAKYHLLEEKRELPGGYSNLENLKKGLLLIAKKGSRYSYKSGNKTLPEGYVFVRDD
jgi:hypothetical protein